MATVELLYDSDTIIADVIWKDATFTSEANGSPGSCQVRVKDINQDKEFVIGKRLELIIDSVPSWTGYVINVRRVFAFAALDTSDVGSLTRLIQIDGVDINILFSKRIVFNPDTPSDVLAPQYPAHTADITVVEDLMADWLDLTGDDIDSSSRVTNVGDVNEDDKARPIQPSQNWGNTMSSIASNTGAIYYIDPDRSLVLADVDDESAPFAITDYPYIAGTAPVVWTYLTTAVAWQANHDYGSEPFASQIVLGDGLETWFITGYGGTGESGGIEPDWSVAGPIGDGDVTWAKVSTWQATTPVNILGGLTSPTTPTGLVYTGEPSDGVTGSSEPAFPPSGSVQDGDGTETGPDPDVVGYRQLNWLIDGTRLANDAIIWGAGAGSSQIAFHRTEDEGSIEQYGRWQVGQFRSDVYKDGTATKIADSIVMGSPESHRGGRYPFPAVTATILEPGIRVGMVVDVRLVTFGLQDNLPCRRETITFDNPTSPRFALYLSHEPDPFSNLFDIPPYIRYIPDVGGVPPHEPENRCVLDVLDDFENRDATGGWAQSSSGPFWTTPDPEAGQAIGSFVQAGEGVLATNSLPNDLETFATPIWPEQRIAVPALSDPETTLRFFFRMSDVANGTVVFSVTYVTATDEPVVSLVLTARAPRLPDWRDIGVFDFDTEELDGALLDALIPTWEPNTEYVLQIHRSLTDLVTEVKLWPSLEDEPDYQVSIPIDAASPLPVALQVRMERDLETALTGGAQQSYHDYLTNTTSWGGADFYGSLVSADGSNFPDPIEWLDGRWYGLWEVPDIGVTSVRVVCAFFRSFFQPLGSSSWEVHKIDPDDFDNQVRDPASLDLISSGTESDSLYPGIFSVDEEVSFSGPGRFAIMVKNTSTEAYAPVTGGLTPIYDTGSDSRGAYSYLEVLFNHQFPFAGGPLLYVKSVDDQNATQDVRIEKIDNFHCSDVFIENHFVGYINPDLFTIDIGHPFAPNTPIVKIDGMYVPPEDYDQNPDDGTIVLHEPLPSQDPIIDVDFTEVPSGSEPPGAPSVIDPPADVALDWNAYGFLTRPNSAKIRLDNVHGTAANPYLISNKSFHDLGSNIIAIELQHCSYIRIEWCDFENVAEPVFAQSSSYVQLVGCRYRNILGPHERVGLHRGNFIQMDGCDHFTVSYNKGKNGDTEDIVSTFGSSNNLISYNHFESEDWSSTSGTGIIVGDGGGSYNVVDHNILINPGQVGLQTISGFGHQITNNIVIGEQRSGSNVGMSIYTPDPIACNNITIANNRILWFNAGGSANNFYNDGGCGTPIGSGNVYGDNTLDIDDYRVVL